MQTTNTAGIATLGSWTLGLKAGVGINTLTATAKGLATTFTATAPPVPDPTPVAAPARRRRRRPPPEGRNAAPEIAGTPFTVIVNAVDAY